MTFQTSCGTPNCETGCNFYTACMETDCCFKGEWCPSCLPSCDKNGHLVAKPCKDFSQKIPLLCTPLSCNVTEISDVTELTITGTYQHCGATAQLFNHKLTDAKYITPNANDSFQWKIPADDLAYLGMEGFVDVEVTMTTSEGSIVLYVCKMRIDQYRWARPCPVVTGSEGGKSNVEIAPDGNVTLYFHESTNPNVARPITSFEVNWADGSPVQTIPVTIPATSATWNASHLYADTGYYDVIVTAVSEGADTPCDPTLTKSTTGKVCVKTVG